MPMYLRISFLLALTVATSYALTEQNVTEHYDAAANGHLIVDVDFGSVDVTASPDGKVSVEAHRKLDSRNESREKEYFADSPLMITKEGETVTVQARPRTAHHHVWSGEITMDARYIVRLPKQYNVDLHTSGGAIAGFRVTMKVAPATPAQMAPPTTQPAILIAFFIRFGLKL